MKYIIYTTLDIENYSYIYLHDAVKSRHVVGWYIGPATIPKLDEKQNVLVIQESRMSRYQAETYHMIAPIRGWMGLDI